MNKGLIIDFASVAAYLAHESDDTQAKFLNVFVKELNTICATDHHAEMQMAMVGPKLTEETKKRLAMLTYKEGE